jgi:hypothetical protein
MEYKDLGCKNLWDWGDRQYPSEYLKCKDLGHKLHEEMGRSYSCINTYTCDICKIKFTTDSSG